MLGALDGAGGLDRLAAAYQAVAAYHGNNYLPLLEAYYKSRPLVLVTSRIQLSRILFGLGWDQDNR